MEEREKEWAQVVGKPLGKKGPLNRCPEKNGRWAQIRVGPVLPPYTNQPTNGSLRKPAEPVLPGNGPVVPIDPVLLEPLPGNFRLKNIESPVPKNELRK